MVTVRDGKIASVGPGAGPVTIDLGEATLLPGFIDTHVHVDWHFDAEGRYHTGPEPAEQNALYCPENAYVTLMAGFTTVQSVGSPRDKALREAIAARGAAGTSPAVVARPDQQPQADAGEMREQVREKQGRRRRPREDLRLRQYPGRRRADAVAGAARRGVRRGEGPGPSVDGARAQPGVDDARRPRRLHGGGARRPGHARRH